MSKAGGLRKFYLVAVHPLSQGGLGSPATTSGLHLTGFLTTTENIWIIMEAFFPLFTYDYQHDYQHYYNQNCYGYKQNHQSYLILVQVGLG